ncbi:hypothetical protein [Frondihabitans australicus]|uniref:Uncharacterized protein n=1 Tax=Frondihabitans australicus TaxID=386892 RepID=A0A495ILL8_9MICO|nr:hypothetical protein [Frondihabitans australicus]RKR76161.1 hypothetical protein C8E83_3326 [Frondihabitans australicus]
MSTTSTTSRAARVARGLGIAVSSVVIAAFSHVAAGGAAPGVLGAVLALVFAALVSIALAGRRLSAPRAVVAVTLSQVVFHVLFSLGAAIPTAHGHDVSMLGMVMSGGTTSTLPALSSPGATSALAAEGARMWAGHTVAAALTVVLLFQGERGFFAVLRVATERLAVLVRAAEAVRPRPAAVPRRAAVAAAESRILRPLEVFLSARPHRGPPRVL